MTTDLLQNCRDACGLQENPPSTLPTPHQEWHCGNCGVIQVPGLYIISRDLKLDNHIDSIVGKSPAGVLLFSPAEEVQLVNGTADAVLLELSLSLLYAH